MGDGKDNGQILLGKQLNRVLSCISAAQRILSEAGHGMMNHWHIILFWEGFRTQQNVVVFIFILFFPPRWRCSNRRLRGKVNHFCFSFSGPNAFFCRHREWAKINHSMWWWHGSFQGKMRWVGQTEGQIIGLRWQRASVKVRGQLIHDGYEFQNKALACYEVNKSLTKVVRHRTNSKSA